MTCLLVCYTGLGTVTVYMVSYGCSCSRMWYNANTEHIPMPTHGLWDGHIRSAQSRWSVISGTRLAMEFPPLINLVLHTMLLRFGTRFAVCNKETHFLYLRQPSVLLMHKSVWTPTFVFRMWDVDQNYCSGRQSHAFGTIATAFLYQVDFCMLDTR